MTYPFADACAISGTTHTDGHAFLGCTAITDVTIIADKEITTSNSIGKDYAHYAKAWESAVGDVTLRIEGSRYIIPNQMCSGAAKIKKVILSDSITVIGESAFKDCAGLTELVLPKDLRTINDNAFNGCAALTGLNLPGSLTSIGKSAFSGCAGLPKLELPDSLTSISESAFSGCAGLTELMLPNSLTSIGESAFSGCAGLTELMLPNSLTSIGVAAFSDCAGLAKITMPTAASMAYNSFLNTSATEIVLVCNGGVQDYAARYQDDSFPSYWGTPWYNTSLAGKQVSVSFTGGTLPAVGNCMFYGCTGLTSMVIPESVTAIGISAFEGCAGLQTVTMSEGVSTIGKSAFSGCAALTELVLPNSLTSIGESAFSGCAGLAKITMPTAASMAYNSFLNTSATEIVLICTGNTQDYSVYRTVSGVKHIGEKAFSGCTGLTAVTLTEGLEEIGAEAFSGSGIAEFVVTGDNLTVGGRAFANCTALTTAQFSGTMKSLGAAAFLDCSALKKVTLPALKTIGTNAFSGCRSLTDIMLPGGLTQIGNNAFNGCEALSRISEPEGVTKIGDYAFRNCSAATCAVLPKSLTTVGYDAFTGCSALTDVYYAGSEEDWQSVSFDENNDPVTSATIHYNGEGRPAPAFTPTLRAVKGQTVKVDLNVVSELEMVTVFCAIYRNGQLVGLRTAAIPYGSQSMSFEFADVDCDEVRAFFTNSSSVPISSSRSEKF